MVEKTGAGLNYGSVAVMKRLGVIANCGKPRAAAVLRDLSEIAEELGLELYAAGDTAELLPGIDAMPGESVFAEVDAVIALGGDGTMLTAVRMLAGLEKPLLGVNIGSLGFMTSVAEQDLRAALLCLCDDTYTVSERCVAEVVVGHDDKEFVYHALNDVVITSGESARVITLGVAVDGKSVTSYMCDGLIVSTPTGSTGHSLSAGGPILTPDTPAFVISPICPHTLSSRPLVTPDSCAVELVVERQSGRSRLSVDGQLRLALDKGDKLKVRRYQQSVRFLHLPDYDYFDVMRRKLCWRGSNI